MKITSLTTRLHSRRYESNLRNSRHPWKEKHALLVFITADTDGGGGSGEHTGVGEAWCENGSTEPLAFFIERDLKPLVIGQPLNPETISTRLLETDAMSNKGGFLYAAASAIDIALHDALARSQNKPLYQLLTEKIENGGGQKSKIKNPSVPVYCSSGMYGDNYTPSHLAHDMSTAFHQGFCGVKIKAGGAPLSEDIARVQALRTALGHSPRLMVDVLWSLNVPQAIALAKALKPFNLHFLEAPTDRHNLPGWQQIKNETHQPLAGPEIEHGLHNFQNFLPLVAFLQADAIVCGGLTELQKINTLALAHQKPLSLHCSGSAVALAANAHFAAAIPNADALEFHLLHQSLFDKLWQSGYKIANGHLHLPLTPGLGLHLAPNDPTLRSII
ncbi:MAG: mandelate racemase/muconate lactonizing enzyme family protein [Phycisphaerales bacterium]|nr:mandelate racemase/muconate lactonizing enzyme family protein [Phycisphaerales bacterium]